ncbi:putative phosphate-repressible Na+/phosphate cotransporter Pho89 [Aulographum hederae CBS 113979]|uniref:Phosphate transporter n=1 Tax=Aulographum hederae CBS 113979 TaxID=1176131 RepID=A0A6G1GZX2_9PEZI|nr:putative phosphate-repressible Na+/phosphate cotransporter Pho89 [Aulographum hederae CBS 113979]
MATLHQYDYIFAIGVIFAFLDAWNIGANDVANSFATSVASRSLTMKQAMCIATVMEFAGAMAVGARVSETIRTKIVSTSLYADDPAILMLGMTCAVVGSSVYLTFATKIGLPVSTTHSIMGGVIGMGVATVGANGVNWGWSGVSQVFAAWAIAPGIAGAFASIIFLITKFGVMKRSNPVRNAFFTVPVYFFLTSALLTMLIVWKGASSKVTLNNAEIAGVIVGVGAAVALLVVVFFLPYLWRKLIKDDWSLRWYQIPMGPLLLRRPEPEPRPEGHDDGIKNYYEGHATAAEMEARQAAHMPANPNDIEKHPKVSSNFDSGSDVIAPTSEQPKAVHHSKLASGVSARPDGPWHRPAVAWWIFKRAALHGVEVDVVTHQSENNMFGGNLEAMHARAAHYDNKAEYMYSFLQVLTAATASFTHGANDISNAVGPFATIFLIWHTGELSSSVPVPNWILAFGGIALVIGLWTYGYNIMRNLGNKITLHSPSRGFSMELGSAVTVIMATRLKLPVSTTQCITGATVGVGLCNGDWRTINWKMVAWIYAGWIITLPVAGIISGCLVGIIINAPRWGMST